MSVWKTTPVSETPDIAMMPWQVFQIPDGSHHIVGYNQTEYEGRVSSKITAWNPLSREAVTRSGRIYVLIGPSGYSSDGHYTWDQWCYLNNILHPDTINVSELYEENNEHE